MDHEGCVVVAVAMERRRRPETAAAVAGRPRRRRRDIVVLLALDVEWGTAGLGVLPCARNKYTRRQDDKNSEVVPQEKLTRDPSVSETVLGGVVHAEISVFGMVVHCTVFCRSRGCRFGV
jgi:hypothetical protein